VRDGRAGLTRQPEKWRRRPRVSVSAPPSPAPRPSPRNRSGPGRVPVSVCVPGSADPAQGGAERVDLGGQVGGVPVRQGRPPVAEQLGDRCVRDATGYSTPIPSRRRWGAGRPFGFPKTCNGPVTPGRAPERKPPGAAAVGSNEPRVGGHPGKSVGLPAPPCRIVSGSRGPHPNRRRTRTTPARTGASGMSAPTSPSFGAWRDCSKSVSPSPLGPGGKLATGPRDHCRRSRFLHGGS
jgi:hypothetical protein